MEDLSATEPQSVKADNQRSGPLFDKFDQLEVILLKKNPHRIGVPASNQRACFAIMVIHEQTSLGGKLNSVERDPVDTADRPENEARDRSIFRSSVSCLPGCNVGVR